MSLLLAQLQNNLDRVEEQIARACERAGRPRESVQLLAVTKYVPTSAIGALQQLGIRHCGESRPQQLLQRAVQFPGLRWDLIGQLQRNKVRHVLPFVRLIHSVDSLRLLERIDQVANELKLRPRVLLEVNVSGEESKQGFTPTQLHEQWPQLTELAHVEISGGMTMAPAVASETAIRDVFRGLRELCDELQQRSPQLQLTELSMGMSGDFELAIEEGATLVRLGSVLFEGCDVEE
ncbi:MAG: YggS family pyridoxal phosphate-dependent enzyme [Planctomycetaceae bacterium]|nr:YggS family pyridoxal phosphate-dependent enzyme [Planctomycetaceae bacterium]